MKPDSVYQTDHLTDNPLPSSGYNFLNLLTTSYKLYRLANSTLSKKHAWRDLQEQSVVKKIFLHLDEFERDSNNIFSCRIILNLNTNREIHIIKTVTDSH